MVATQRNKTFAKDDWQPIKILSLHGELFEEFAQGEPRELLGLLLRQVWSRCLARVLKLSDSTQFAIKH